MKYIALLRGINVGKGPRVNMKQLKLLAEESGCMNVSTYINSGNLLFESEKDAEMLKEELEEMLSREFNAEIPVLLRTDEQIRRAAASIPDEWQNDSEQKTDIAFLFPEADTEDIIEKLPFSMDYVNLYYRKGFICWNVKRADQGKSRLSKIVGTALYRQMTVRNVNTVRYLAGINP